MNRVAIGVVSLLVVTVLVGCFEVKKKNSAIYTPLRDAKALLQPMPFENSAQEDMFILGRSFFTIPWVAAPSATTARDGLGPLFSANSCQHCHKGGGGGLLLEKDSASNAVLSRSMVMRVGKLMVDKTHGFVADSTYGRQLSVSSITNVQAEVVANAYYEPSNTDGLQRSMLKLHLLHGTLDKDSHVALHRALPLVGLGLIEQIPTAQIIAHADENDSNADGISGRANWVYNPETNRNELGRFTWKAAASTVKMQVANAAINDMGLTSPLYRSENCTNKERDCLVHNGSKEPFDLPMRRLDAITFYLSHLKVPKSVVNTKAGKKLFRQLGCAQCHHDSFTTTAGIEIAPYSDFLLHDMGKALSDGHTNFRASAQEFRTPPLWSLVITKRIRGEYALLHDGRARSVDEAIRWHGGEAAASNAHYQALREEQKKALAQFLEEI